LISSSIVRILDDVKFFWDDADVVHQDAAGETDRLVDDLLAVTHRVHQVVLEVALRYDLTTQQVGLLRVLNEPMSMRAFAQDVSCDPSNVTGLVDRVERLGLVERVPDPSDRRVRMLTLTAKGRRIRDRVNRDLATELGDGLRATAATKGQIARLLRSMNPEP
jgi:DNA-binding MarR family transcriptional regulator